MADDVDAENEVGQTTRVPAAARDPGATARLLLTLLDEDGPGALAIAATSLRRADLAAAFETLSDERGRQRLFVALPVDIAAEVLEELSPETRDSVLEQTDDHRLSHILAEADADDAVYFLDHLDDQRAAKLLAQMDSELRRQLSEQYELPDNAVGRIMRRDLTTLRSFMTVGQAIDHLRTHHEHHQHEEDAVAAGLYVVDAESRLVGVVAYRQLVFTNPRTPVSAVMQREPVMVMLDADREEAARLMQKYDLVALPVVDTRRHIVGLVTVDDMVDVVQEEATEDMQKLGGMESLGAPYLQMPLTGMLRKRAGWLSLLFVGEMLTASVMAVFEDSIEHLHLSLFLPLIISSGGNSGSQATTLVIRSLALRELHLRDWWRVLSRELMTGGALGLMLGAIGFLRIFIWHLSWPNSAPAYGAHFHVMGMTVLASLVGVVLWGSVSGAMLPFILRRIGLDPASASAPLVATLVDVTGLLIYFTVAQTVFAALMPAAM